MPLNPQTLMIKHDDNGRPIDKYEIFCLHYLKDFDTVAAFEAANPNSKNKNPSQAAYKFLNSSKTQERLKEMIRPLFNGMEQDVRDIIEETKRIVSFNPLKIMRIDAEGKPVLDLSECDETTMRMLRVRFSSTVDKDGLIHNLYDVQPKDSMDALEKLYKYHKLYSTAVNDAQQNRMIQVNVNFPIPGEHWRSGKPVPQDVIDDLDQWQ